MINEAIQHYHDLLADGMAESTYAVMQEELAKRRLFFGSVPVCRVMRPHFYMPDQWEFLAVRTKIVLRAFNKLHQACMESAELRAQLGLEEYEEQLLHTDKGRVRVPWSSSRLDAFYRPETGYLRFVEYNAETPAGMGYGDGLTNMFLSLPVMHKFRERYDVLKTYGLPQLLGVLLRGYSDWGGSIKPQIAIIDWQDVPTHNEHEITREYFEREGYRTILADPRAVEYRDDHAWIGDFRVDIVYKRVLISELVGRLGINAPLVRAVREGKVFMTNSFSAKMLAKKASLALLSDERNVHLFDVDERSAIEQHIPWTRIVSERKTIYQGKEIDLLPYISQNRHEFVIKPNDEYGGSGVVLGWEVSSEAWDAAIHNALQRPHVVQQRVTVIERDFPMMVDGKLDISTRYVDADPYVFYGQEVGGCLTRLSGSALLNVTAGTGSVVPMFVIRKKG